MLAPPLVVFDAIVKPERTPLIDLAERNGCTTVYGREMMRGQIARIVDFFLAMNRGDPVGPLPWSDPIRVATSECAPGPDRAMLPGAPP